MLGSAKYTESPSKSEKSVGSGQKLRVSQLEIWKDMEANETYVINSTQGTQKRCLSNGENLK